MLGGGGNGGSSGFDGLGSSDSNGHGGSLPHSRRRKDLSNYEHRHFPRVTLFMLPKR